MQVKSKIGRIFEIPSAQEEMEIRRGITDDSEMGEVSDELLGNR